jgi:hypothetical protein
MVDWVPGTLRFMDGLAARSDWMEFARMMGREPTMKKLPTEYWATNCFAGSSPPARIEYEMRYELGVDTMMFGVDFPHFESIWPVTKETLQGTWDGSVRTRGARFSENPSRNGSTSGFSPVERAGYEVSELLDRRMRIRVAAGSVSTARATHRSFLPRSCRANAPSIGCMAQSTRCTSADALGRTEGDR